MNEEPESSSETDGRSPEKHALLLRFLCDNDVPCPVCGYNLRNLTHDVCPECGQQIALKVGAVSPRFGAFLLFLAPLIMAAGVTLLLSITMLLYRPPPTEDWGWWLIEALGFVGAVIAIWNYWKRTAFLRQCKRNQFGLVGLSWSVVVLLYVISAKFGI